MIFNQWNFMFGRRFSAYEHLRIICQANWPEQQGVTIWDPWSFWGDLPPWECMKFGLVSFDDLRKMWPVDHLVWMSNLYSSGDTRESPDHDVGWVDGMSWCFFTIFSVKKVKKNASTLHVSQNLRKTHVQFAFFVFGPYENDLTDLGAKNESKTQFRPGNWQQKRQQIVSGDAYGIRFGFWLSMHLGSRISFISFPSEQ